MTAAFLIIMVVGLVTNARILRYIRSARHDLSRRSGRLRDLRSGIYSRTALDTMLSDELAHMSYRGIPGAVVVFTLYTSSPSDAIVRISSRIRANEVLYRYSWHSYCIALWNVDDKGAAIAVARLGKGLLEDSQTCVIDAGVARIPYDGNDASEAIAIALRRNAPIQLWIRAVEHV